ncbi:MAG: hypothetical protein ACYTGN_05685 [Planctomycetota bacterium]|jgi:ribosomal protein S1
MSKFMETLLGLEGQKVRFFVGGGDRGSHVQGPVTKVDGDMIYIEKEGEIRGTMHAITLHADAVRYFEIDIVVSDD